MAKRFFVRAQLHGVDEGDDAYVTLHDEMESRGFTRTITMGEVVKRLPTGTYVGQAASAGLTKERAGARIRAAIDATGYSGSYVVAETDVTLYVGGLDDAE